MCFSENQSYFNALLLFATGIYSYSKTKLAIGLFFLGIKDLIQGILYRTIRKGDKALTGNYAILSWIHICFQPLCLNLFLSFFDPKNIDYWKWVLIACFFYAIVCAIHIKDLDIYHLPSCNKKYNPSNDFCADKTTAYQGKYHLGYKFNGIDQKIIYPGLYLLLMFFPAIFTKVRPLLLAWVGLVLGVAVIFERGLNVWNGETAALWCFLSILYFIPITLFSDQISKMLL